VPRIAAALVLVALSTSGCDELTGDPRLVACGSELPGNRIRTTLELPSRQLPDRFGVSAEEHPEVLSDRIVFVVVFDGPAVMREVHGDSVISRMRHDAICVWYAEREVAVYDNVTSFDLPEGPP
jgi:hypothetical protein